MRLLTPFGFMPAFDGGRLAITPCEAAAPLPIAMNHHRMGGHDGDQHKAAKHQSCPYATAAAQSLIGSDPAPVVTTLILAPQILLGRAYLFIERHRAADRPRSRAPPLA